MGFPSMMVSAPSQSPFGDSADGIIEDVTDAVGASDDDEAPVRDARDRVQLTPTRFLVVDIGGGAVCLADAPVQRPAIVCLDEVGM